MNVHIGRFRLASSAAPAAATLLVVCIGLAAGNWQLGRATEKREAAQRSADAPAIVLDGGPADATRTAWRKVKLEGRFAPRYEIYLDNRVRDGRVGYEVLTPLKPAQGDRYVLVDRGWLPAGPTRQELPAVPAREGWQRLEGIAWVPPAHPFALSDAQPEGRLWQHVSLERYGQATGLPLQPVVVLQTSDNGDGLDRHWPRPADKVAMHLGYAVQWFSLAAAAVVFFLATHLERVPHERPA